MRISKIMGGIMLAAFFGAMIYVLAITCGLGFVTVLKGIAIVATIVLWLCLAVWLLTKEEDSE